MARSSKTQSSKSCAPKSCTPKLRIVAQKAKTSKAAGEAGMRQRVGLRLVAQAIGAPRRDADGAIRIPARTVGGLIEIRIDASRMSFDRFSLFGNLATQLAALGEAGADSRHGAMALEGAWSAGAFQASRWSIVCRDGAEFDGGWAFTAAEWAALDAETAPESVPVIGARAA